MLDHNDSNLNPDENNEENLELNDDQVEYSEENEKIVKSDFWIKLKKFAGKIPFTKEAVSMYYCAVDSKTPLWAKGIAFSALAYFISPIDTIPDALVALGFTDDAAIIAAALTAIGKNVTDEHREMSDNFFDSKND